MNRYIDQGRPLCTGFQTFVLPQTQPGALLPYYVLYSTPGAIAVQNQFSEDFEGNLTLSLKAAYLPPEVNIHFLDEYSDLNVAITEAEKKGLQPEQPCLNGVYNETTTKSLCDDAGDRVL